jgi:hypothetical protein
MGKDSEFKSQVKVCNYNSVDLSDLGKYYHPDLTLENKSHLIIFESSSTGDRKVHIGELVQFLTYINSNSIYNEYSFILSLCGASETSPSIQEEIGRLQYYYDSFPLSKVKRSQIKKIAVVDQNDFDWANLDEEIISSMKGIQL